MAIEIVTGAAAQANVASLPANVLLYGPPGTQKTTDAARTFIVDGLCRAFVIPCEDGALKPLVGRGFSVPDHPKETVKTWGAMQEAIGYLHQHRSNYLAAIIDGITPFTGNIYKEAEDHFKGSRNKFQVPLFVRNALVNLREWIRQIGLHSILIAHALPPAVQDGVFYPGCPQFSPKSMTREYFGQVDTVLRVDMLTIPGRPAQRVYYTGGEEWPKALTDMAVLDPPDRRAWLTKNREGVNDAVVPADLSAFLRRRQPPYLGL